jgi:hypothetical protein
MIGKARVNGWILKAICEMSCRISRIMRSIESLNCYPGTSRENHLKLEPLLSDEGWLTGPRFVAGSLTFPVELFYSLRSERQYYMSAPQAQDLKMISKVIV